MAERFDVIVIGGGPAGSLCAALLRRYTPTMRVALVEQEAFPRFHIGESLVLEANRVLQDAGVLAHRIGDRVFDAVIRNMAVYGYWKNADIDVEYSVGRDPATIVIVTAPEGWVWCIPVRAGVASVGYVTPAETFKRRGKEEDL